MTSGSGSQDGLLCVWDLLTGNVISINKYKIHNLLKFTIYHNFCIFSFTIFFVLFLLQEHACIVFKLMMVL